MKFKILLFASLSILIFSCEKESALEKYYNQEGNFSGSIYDALDSTGIYNYFLKGIDSTEMANQLKNTLLTVVAPSDIAFRAYLDKYGYDSISSIPQNILEDLMGHHVITWPHSPASLEQDPNWFKRLTNMGASTATKYDYITDSEILVFKGPKYLQFYFPEMLNTYGGTEADYKLLTGKDLSPSTGFNINSTQVDSIRPYGNGWVYYVNEVIEPIQNLDNWLTNAPEYSYFNKMFSRFYIYVIDEGSTPPPVKRSNLYQTQRSYRADVELDFEPVARVMEQANEYTINASSNFTVLAPENNAFDVFFNTYFQDFPGFKESVEVIDKTSLDNLHVGKIVRAMIKPYLFIQLPIFPSGLFSNNITGYDGTEMNFSEQDVKEYTLCSNGYAYGLNAYVVPRTFKSVLQPAYTTPTYKYFAAAVERSETHGYLSNKNANFTVFMPTDSAFIKNHIILVDEYTFVSEHGGTASAEGLTETVFLDIDPLNPEAPELIPTQDLFQIVFNHLFLKPVIPNSQKQFAQNAPGIYVGITADSIWSGGNIRYDIEDTAQYSIPRITQSITGTIDNGQVYVVDDLINSPTYTMGDMIKIDTAFSSFKAICENSGLYLSDGTLNVFGNIPTVFIPTNAALDQYITDGHLPSDVAELQYFIKYFFMDHTVFTTETINETVVTLSKDVELSTEFNIVYKEAELNGTYEDLKIKGSNNSSFLNVIEGAKSNIICSDGIIHQIDGVLN